MKDEELLALAKSKYPVGTEYYNASSSIKVPISVKGELRFYSWDSSRGKKSRITDSCGGSVYYDGRWAVIVGESQISYNYLIL